MSDEIDVRDHLYGGLRPTGPPLKGAQKEKARVTTPSPKPNQSKERYRLCSGGSRGKRRSPVLATEEERSHRNPQRQARPLMAVDGRSTEPKAQVSVSGPTCVDLRKRFPGYRLQWDESHIPGQDFDPWLLEIPCKYGKIYPYGGKQLCAYTDRPRLIARLRAIAGAVAHQEGDFELVVRFPVDGWKPYFQLLRAKRRRTVTPMVRAALQKATEQRRKGVSRAVEARSHAGGGPPNSEQSGKVL
jgi:hypothetical protein